MADENLDRLYNRWREVERVHGKNLDRVAIGNIFLMPLFGGTIVYREAMGSTKHPWIGRLATRGLFLTASLATVSLFRWVTIDSEHWRMDRPR